jgi:hypothetical protein
MNIPTFGLNRSHAIVAGVFLIIGGIIGFKLAPDQPKIMAESAAPAIQLPSGGYVAERVPDAPVPQSMKKAAKEAGGRVVRAGNVKVKPTQSDCPEVNIDWALTKQKDDSHRMIFRTDDGTIIGAKDIPVESVSIVKHPKWSAGVIAPISDWKHAGPIVERHFGKLSLGVAAVRDVDDKWVGMATVKVSW